MWFDCKIEIEDLKLPIEGFSLQFSVYITQIIKVLDFFSSSQSVVCSLQLAIRSLRFAVEFPN